MKKIIENNIVYFYDEYDNLIMYISHMFDECIWCFQSNNEIFVNNNTELYDLLEKFMENDYEFKNNVLQNYKDSEKLVWYSDCYYNPDDEWSIASVSCLNIQKEKSAYKIWATKKLEELIQTKDKNYVICFSPAGNGQYSKNLINNLTLQDDFIIQIYQKLLHNSRVLKK